MALFKSAFVASSLTAQSELTKIALRDGLSVTLDFDPRKNMWEATIQPLGRATRMWARHQDCGEACAKVLMQYRALRHAIVNTASHDNMRTARRVGVEA